MTRGVDDRPVVIVESDADISLLGSHTRPDTVRYAPGMGREAALGAALLHADGGDDWVFTVLDRDFHTEALPSNCVATAHYDLEAEAIAIGREAVIRLVFAHITTAQNLECSLAGAEVLLARAEGLATIVGGIRYVDHVQSIGLATSSFPMHELYARTEAGADPLGSAVELACLRAGKRGLAAEIADTVRGHLENSDPPTLINGHDLMGAIRALISAEAVAPSGRDFARAIHALITCEIFLRLSIAASIGAWYSALRGDELWDCVA